MATVAEVIGDALAEIMVAGSEAPLEPSEYQSSIRMMNDYMLSLDADGVKLGYTTVDTLDDVITIAAGAIYGLKKNLAIRMAPQFGVSVSPQLQMDADKGLRVMEKIAHVVPDTAYPNTLPIGSGNYRNSCSTFFPGVSEE